MSLARAVKLINEQQFEQARTLLQPVLEAEPENAEVLNVYAVTMMALNQPEVAAGMLQKSLRLAPRNARAHNNMGILLRGQERLREAERSFLEAIACNADATYAYQNLCNLYLQSNRFREAWPHLRVLVRLLPDNAFYLRALAITTYQYGDSAEALKLLDDLATRFPDDAGAQLARAVFLPHIMGSVEEIAAARKDMGARLDALKARAQREPKFRLGEDPVHETAFMHFYLSYHGLSSRELLEKLAATCCALCPTLNFTAPVKPRGEKLRIGIVSGLMYDHSIGRCFAKVIDYLAQQPGCELVLFAILDESKRDAVHQQAAAACKKVVYIPEFATLGHAKALVLSEPVDLLLYTDVAMLPLTYWLAYSRLAPVQAVLPGHPDTTGLSTIDHYVVSEELATDEADDYYTEKRVRLEGWQIVMQPPPQPTRLKTRAELGLPEDKRIYACPMLLPKLHPDFDAAIVGILRQDPEGVMVLNEDMNNPSWAPKLRARLAQAAPDVAERVLFLPWLPFGDFVSYVQYAAVVLDPFHFGGGTTSIYVLGLGTPVVTWPDPYERSRTAASCYQRMGAGEECVVDSLEAYVAQAVRLGTDAPYREGLQARIKERAPEALFEDTRGAEALAQWMLSLAR